MNPLPIILQIVLVAAQQPETIQPNIVNVQQIVRKLQIENQTSRIHSKLKTNQKIKRNMGKIIQGQKSHSRKTNHHQYQPRGRSR